MKSLRQEKILKIISEQRVDTQGKLRDLLLGENITVTQATLSRDINELHLKKVTDENGNVGYAAESHEAPQLPQLFSDSVISVDHAMNTVVFKCHTGMAQGACAVFDKLDYRGTVGSLAGDDTFIVIMRTPSDAEFLAAEMSGLLGMA